MNVKFSAIHIVTCNLIFEILHVLLDYIYIYILYIGIVVNARGFWFVMKGAPLRD